MPLHPGRALPLMFYGLFVTYLFLLAATGAVAVALPEGLPAVAGAGAVIGLAAATALVVARRLTRPLAELAEGARQLAEGNFDHTVATRGGPEHVQLARTLNATSGRLASMFRLLEHDREQLRAILSGMAEGVIAIDERRRVLFANESAGRLLEFEPATAVGGDLCEVTRLAAFRAAVEKGLAGTGPYREELEVSGAAPRFLAVYVSRFPGHGTPGAVIVIDDMTDVRHAERTRQDFVANASHELKTPLAVIRSSIETLQEGAADDPAARAAFMDQIMREVDRLTDMIKDMLSLARIESGTLGLEPHPVPLGRAISDCMERHHPRADTKTLTLVEKPPTDVPADVPAWADPDALRQVLDNLVDNAIKYTPNGGRIAVRWGATADSVSFEVEDTGVGIPEADVNRVFERFYRVDKARGRAEGSTGLGLSIVKHLVQAMRGQIRVSSKVGKGTTFRVTLPRAGSA